MFNKKLRKAITGIIAATMIMGAALPVCAADQTITSDDTNKTRDVAVTATVVSSFKVRLPMAIELEETDEVEDYGPVFESPSSIKIGVQGNMYGKYLNLAVKDSRTNSATYNQADKLTFGQATYNSGAGTYDVASEEGSVTASVDPTFHKFYQVSVTTLPDDDSTNIVSGGASETFTEYPFSVRTTSRVTADGTTLYYGAITVSASVVNLD